MSDLTDLQFDILDCLYFVEPFDRIVEEVREPAAIVGAEIKEMIARKWVQPMQYDEQAGDYMPTFFHDADDMRAYHYLATKKGLMLHNGRG